MLHDILLFLTGIVVGAMNAIAGGGMLIGFPVLLAVGLSPLTANATNYIVVLPGQLAAILGYRKYLRRVPRSYLLLIIPCVIGGAIGSYGLKHTSPGRFADLVPGLLLAALVLFAVQPLLHFQLTRHLRGKAKTSLPLLLIGLALLPISVYGGYFGIGFGFVILAFLGFTKLRDHIHRSNALKNIAALSIALVAVFSLANSGLIDWQHGIVMGIGCAIGGFGGARLVQRVPSHLIRVFVLVVGITAVIYLALRTY